MKRQKVKGNSVMNQNNSILAQVNSFMLGRSHIKGSSLGPTDQYFIRNIDQYTEAKSPQEVLREMIKNQEAKTLQNISQLAGEGMAEYKLRAIQDINFIQEMVVKKYAEDFVRKSVNDSPLSDSSQILPAIERRSNLAMRQKLSRFKETSQPLSPALKCTEKITHFAGDPYAFYVYKQRKAFNDITKLRKIKKPPDIETETEELTNKRSISKVRESPGEKKQTEYPNSTRISPSRRYSPCPSPQNTLNKTDIITPDSCFPNISGHVPKPGEPSPQRYTKVANLLVKTKQPRGNHNPEVNISSEQLKGRDGVGAGSLVRYDGGNTSETHNKYPRRLGARYLSPDSMTKSKFHVHSNSSTQNELNKTFTINAPEDDSNDQNNSLKIEDFNTINVNSDPDLAPIHVHVPIPPREKLKERKTNKLQNFMDKCTKSSIRTKNAQNIFDKRMFWEQEKGKIFEEIFDKINDLDTINGQVVETILGSRNRLEEDIVQAVKRAKLEHRNQFFMPEVQNVLRDSLNYKKRFSKSHRIIKVLEEERRKDRQRLREKLIKPKSLLAKTLDKI